MNHKEWYVGIDLGGTSIKLALITEDGEIAYKAEDPTSVASGGDHILHQMNKLIERGLDELHLDRSQLKGVGIGAPAFLDLENGFVHEAVNLGWKNFALKDKLQEMTQLPVIVDNDANIAALGEMWPLQVIEIKVVEPTDLSVLKQTDRSLLTLITCEPLYSNDYRLIVVAEELESTGRSVSYR